MPTPRPQPKPKPQPTLVLAFNLREFVDWCRENDIHPRSKEYKYVSSVKVALGYHQSKVITLDGFYQRRDGAEIAREVYRIQES